MQRLVQRIDGQATSDVGGLGITQAVQKQEVMDHPGHPHGGDVDPGLSELVGVLLALVPQHVLNG